MPTADGLLALLSALPFLAHTQKRLGPMTSRDGELESHSWTSLDPAKIPPPHSGGRQAGSLSLTLHPQISPLSSGHMLRAHVNLCLLCGAPGHSLCPHQPAGQPPSSLLSTFSKLRPNSYATRFIFRTHQQDQITLLLKEPEWNLHLSLSFLSSDVC